jgi:diguanylate cyclase (GGDEF)-like protein/PAS domain S-box-containing protein
MDSAGMRFAGPSPLPDMPADRPDRPYPAPFDTSTFIFPAEWHALSDLLGGADTGLLILRDGVILGLNPQLAQQLGYDETDLAGQPVEALFPTSKSAAIHGDGQSPVAEGAPVQLMTKAGTPVEYRLVENRIDALTDARCNIWVLQPGDQAESETVSGGERPALIDYLPDLVLVCDKDLTLRYTNRAVNAITGSLGHALNDLVHQEDRAALRTSLEKVDQADGTALLPISCRLRQRDGSWRHVAGHARNLLSDPQVHGILISARDVTEQLQQQQHITADKKRQLHYLNRLFRMAQQPHANLTSALTVILKATAKALGTHRCAYWEVGGAPTATHCVMTYDDRKQNFVEDTPDPTFATAFFPLLQQVLRSERQMVVADVDQEARAALACEYFHATAIKSVMITPVQQASGVDGLLIVSHFGEARPWRTDESEFVDNVGGLISLIFREVERSKAEAQLRHLAHHDSLTGLPNRHFLFDLAADVFPKVTAEATTVAAFFIDLDGFKKVNDNLGHSVGDELLKAAAMRLKNAVRKDDILVRLGGDEFMLLARNLSDMQIAEDIAQQIVESVRAPFLLQGHELSISASVGIALYPFDGTDIDTLMKKADIAMYQAKSAGRDQYRVFGSRATDNEPARPGLERELRRAIAEQELRHYFQPQVDLRTGEVRCVEALLRWQHPTHGVLLPSNFLPAAEKSGLIRLISAWVLNDACDQIKKWAENGTGDFSIAINLSASQLMDRGLLTVLENALERTGVPGKRLEWEITESTAMQNNALSASMLDWVTEMEIGLSIDDFGTGYSNMAYLQRYPVHKVKIDGSFVSGLPGKGDDRAVTDAIISMAKPLGLRVVAEGVETPQQMEYLREHGCDIAQGYYFTQPLTAEQFEKWLIRH